MSLAPVRVTRRHASVASPIAFAVLGLALLLAALSGRTESSAAVPSTDSVTVNAAADTLIDEALPSTIHGSQATIGVRAGTPNQQFSALRFDITAPLYLSSRPGDIQVQSAILRLRVSSAPAAPFEIIPTFLGPSSAWNESSTWNSANAAWANGQSLTNEVVATTDDWVEIDVTASIDAILAGTTNNGWSLRPASAASTDGLAFHSREAADPANRPQLVITYWTSTASMQPGGAYGSDSAGASEDTYIQQANPASLNGALDHLAVDLYSGNRSDALLRFDLDAEIPDLDRSRVLSATLSLPVQQAGLARVLHAARICRPGTLFDDGAITGATYADIPFASLQQLETSAGYSYTENSTATIQFDVTTIVQSWANGEANLGLRIYQQSPLFGSPNPLFLHSFNATDPASRPLLTVEYVHDQGTANSAPSPSCTPATPTPTSTNTPTNTPTHTPTNTPTGTLTPTPTGTRTPTVTPTGTLTPTATTTGTPSSTVTSSQVAVSRPVAGVAAGRSRLTFEATHGSLSPTALVFAIRRQSDNQYWNGATGQWQAASVTNAAALANGKWTYAVTGAGRRAFAGLTVIVEARATVGSQTHVSATVTATVR